MQERKIFAVKIRGFYRKKWKWQFQALVPTNLTIHFVYSLYKHHKFREKRCTQLEKIKS